LLRWLSGHTDSVNSVTYSPDGGLLASSGNDWTMRVWDTKTGALRHTLSGHAAGLPSAAFSPDGSLLASGSDDGTAAVWGLTP
jgi:WD40 repeat protein